MLLEQQLAILAELGLPLAPDITVDDLLLSFSRKLFENEPFDLVLFCLGIEVEREPWGRQICARAWNFDTECISGTGDYVEIIKHLSSLTGEPNFFSNISDYVNIEEGQGWLQYTVAGKSQRWNIEVNNDWADTLMLTYVMNALERDDYRFYAKDNGQAMILFWLRPEAAARLNELTHNALQLVTG